MEGYHRYYDRDSGRWITALDCPQCARFREKLDREKLAKVAYEHMFPDRYGWEKETDEHLLSNYRNLADHYIKYLTE